MGIDRQTAEPRHIITVFAVGDNFGSPAQEGGAIMMERKLTMAEIMLIAGTRVALGAGIGLLISTRLNNDQRKAAGWALALFGALTTIPLAVDVIGKGGPAGADISSAT